MSPGWDVVSGSGSGAVGQRTATGGACLPSFVYAGHRSRCIHLSGLALLLSGCEMTPRAALGQTPSMLDPRGPAAAEIADLWWLMLMLATAVFLVVIGFYAFVLLRFRERRQAEPGNHPRHATALVVVGGFLAPAVILLVLIAATVRAIHATALPPSEPTVLIQVIGRQWWWEVRYPQLGVVTANEIHIPVGRPVLIELASDDVIHSFWVPRLQGKLDMTPGHVTTTWLLADEPGVFRGICAEFCGIQHALMAFEVVAESDDEFAVWVESRRQPALEPVSQQARLGRQIFMSSSCASCHAIQGVTQPEVVVGPDLTHVASRLTLAAGTLANTPENLAAFITRPREIKPGVYMPDIPLTPDQIEALTAYLASLE